MLVYKTFGVDKNDGLTSVLLDESDAPFFCRYAKDRWTFPPIGYPDAWLWAWENLRAVGYGWPKASQVWECKAGQATKMVHCCSPNGLWLKAYYSYPLLYEYHLTQDILQCDSIMPVRRIK